MQSYTDCCEFMVFFSVQIALRSQLYYSFFYFPCDYSGLLGVDYVALCNYMLAHSKIQGFECLLCPYSTALQKFLSICFDIAVIPENIIKTTLVEGGTSSLFSFSFHIFLPGILAKGNENCRMAQRVSEPVITYFVCLLCEVFHPECFEDLWMCAYSEACRVKKCFSSRNGLEPASICLIWILSHLIFLSN